MALHRLACLTLGVPNVVATAAYYEDFGLEPVAGTSDEQARRPRFNTLEDGEQLRLEYAPRRKPLEVDLEADDIEDLQRASSALTKLEFDHKLVDDVLSVFDAGTGVRVQLTVAPRREPIASPAPEMNWHGQNTRLNVRADAVLRESRPQPRRLGHAVLASTDQERSMALFHEALGFKVSDWIKGVAAFMRCSSDHHNLVIASAPVAYVHHTSWQLDDVDEIGRAAAAMVEEDPSRHVWGLGRHHVGSNYFWYLRDPAGNYSEYYSDMDCIVDDRLWKVQIWDGAQALYNWGPPPPPSFANPEDVAGYMAQSH